jgi:hypothetical protein
MKNFLLPLCLLSFLHTFAQSTDEYTRYELREPSTNSFRILYEVSATTPGATLYHNTLRKGSGHTVDRVVDVATGKTLPWTIVPGEEARKNGLAGADNETDYLQITLAHPVAEKAEYRLLIDKTYTDAKSYYAEGDRIVFSRTLGIKRNAVVLPKGYELVACNYPSQIMMEADGRIKISFVNRGSSAVPLRIEGRKLSKTVVLPASQQAEALPPGQGRNKSKARLNYTFAERARQTQEIVYFLQQPETNSFRLYHDYTETRPGTSTYLNVVRAGSRASNPSAINLDTGKPLVVETLSGKAVTEKGINRGGTLAPDAEVIVIWFDPVQEGMTTRLRIEETYTDPDRYLVVNDELIWDRAFGRVHNTVVLPQGWWLTASDIPATVSVTEAGLISLYFLNDSPGDIDVYLKAMRK